MKPDLVLVMTDQQRRDQLGYSSLGHFDTPNLDRLAASGVTFDNAYSASTTCVPARVGLLTGLLPHRAPTQINRLALREGFWTVAHALQEAGYETALIGKMHFAPVRAQHGFETMRLCEHLNAQGYEPPDGETLSDDYHDWLISQGVGDWRFRDGRLLKTIPDQPFPYDARLHPTAWIERETVSFLERRTRDRPLFLVVSFPHPHAPYNPPEPYASMFDPADSGSPRSGFEVNESLPTYFRQAMSRFGDMPTHRADGADAEVLACYLALVRGLIKQIDDSVGRITEHLDLDDGVMFFTSDHGDYAGNRGLLWKTPWIPYDDLARVPFFVTGADVGGGRRSSRLVQSCDFALTCLDYAGVEPPAGVDFGTRSLRPGLRDPSDGDDSDRAVFCATNMGSPMVRRGAHKYLWQHGWNVPMLFDVVSDPDESRDLSGDPAYRDITSELHALLHDELSLGIPDLPSFESAIPTSPTGSTT